MRNVMRVRIAFALIVMVLLAGIGVAQDRVSLRRGLKAGDESRYQITASVETNVTPKGPSGIGGTSRAELTATVLVRTLSLGKTGEINQEALVEAISFKSEKGGVSTAPISKEIPGRKIEYAFDSYGYLSRCSIPDSRGYATLADLLFSIGRWYPIADVAIGGSWEAGGRGHLYTDTMSEIGMGSNTVYKIAGLAKGIASIEGAVTLNQKGASAFSAEGGLINVSVIAGGSGTAQADVDVNTGLLIGGSTESRVEGTLINIRPTAAGEKMDPREGSLVETSKFTIKLLQ